MPSPRWWAQRLPFITRSLSAHSVLDSPTFYASSSNFPSPSISSRGGSSSVYFSLSCLYFNTDTSSNSSVIACTCDSSSTSDFDILQQRKAPIILFLLRLQLNRHIQSTQYRIKHSTYRSRYSTRVVVRSNTIRVFIPHFDTTPDPPVVSDSSCEHAPFLFPLIQDVGSIFTSSSNTRL